MQRLRAKLVSLTLIPLLIVAFAPGLSAHLHSGEVLVPADWREAHPGPNIISLTVAVDEEWLRLFGPDAERQARRVVEISATHLRAADIDLRFAAMETWTSNDDSANLHGLLDALELSGSPAEADMVVGLTAAQYASKVDGVARPRRPYMVIKHHPRRPQRDAYVLTHEIGHALGLNHHACPDGRCFMADHSYDARKHWCSDHLEILTANGGYFRYAQEIGQQA